MDFHDFLVAYFTDWVLWVSGPVSALLALWGALRKEVDQRRLWIFAAAIVCFFIAPVHIWTKEHRARLAAEKTVADLSIPHFSLNVLTINVAENSATHRTWIHLSIQLKNSGAPAEIDPSSWVLTIHGLNSEVAQPEDFDSNEAVRCLFQPDGTAREFVREDMLTEKTYGKPTGRIGSVEGILAFSTAIPRAEVLKDQTVFDLRYADVTGREYQTSYSMHDANHTVSKSAFMPGIKYSRPMPAAVCQKAAEEAHSQNAIKY